MPPSQIRKEEAELRQIAKQSRAVRKEAHLRERKAQQRERRKAATRGGDEAPSPPPSTAPRKRQAALILPEEVRELRERLGGTATTEGTTALVSASKLKNKKGGTKRGDARGGSKSTPAATTIAAATCSTVDEPNYHIELHHKHKLVLVDVVLHRVPESKIDISETSASQLVVDTTKHTRKYRLVVPMPDQLSIVPKEATYELINGVLHCRLPIAGGIIPADLQQEWDRMISSIREQKTMRFRVGKDGDLTVRKRQALLAKDTAAQAALLERRRAAQKRTRGTESSDEEEAEAEEEEIPPAKVNKTEVKRAGPSALELEHARAVEIAKEAASKARVSIRQKVQLAKEVQMKRQARLQTRTTRKETRDSRKHASFQRVLEEQKQQLVARAALQAETDAVERKRERAKKSGAARKSVSFA